MQVDKQLGQKDLNYNPLDFIERNAIVTPIVKLRCACAAVISHCFGFLQCTAAFQVIGDPGRPPAVVTEFGSNPGIFRPPVHHLPGVRLGQRISGEPACTTFDRLEQRATLITSDTGVLHLFMQVSFQIMMARHFMHFATFFMQSEP